MFRFSFACALALASLGATSQRGGALGTTIDYQSPFESYRSWSTEPPRDWREVNDEVERLGGHAGHLRAAPVAPMPHTSPPANSEPAPASADTGERPSRGLEDRK